MLVAVTLFIVGFAALVAGVGTGWAIARWKSPVIATLLASIAIVEAAVFWYAYTKIDLQYPDIAQIAQLQSLLGAILILSGLLLRRTRA